MAERTLQEVLGANATQNAATITLSKADLGLTSAVCTADKVIAAITIKALANLPQTYFDSDLSQTVYVGRGYDQLLPRGEEQINYIIRQLTVNMAELDNFSAFNPENY